jgi:hypothetical protein
VTFAVVDRDQEGIAAVLMLLDDEAEAEAIAFELRDRDVRADVIQVDRALLAQLVHSGR